MPYNKPRELVAVVDLDLDKTGVEVHFLSTIVSSMIPSRAPPRPPPPHSAPPTGFDSETVVLSPTSQPFPCSRSTSSFLLICEETRLYHGSVYPNGRAHLVTSQYSRAIVGSDVGHQLIGTMFVNECNTGLLVSCSNVSKDVKMLSRVLKTVRGGEFTVHIWEGDTLVRMFGLFGDRIVDKRTQMLADARLQLLPSSVFVLYIR